MQTIWISPASYVSGDHTLEITYSFVSQPCTVIRCTNSGDLKWLTMGLPLPPDTQVEQVIIYYQLSNPQSFISQIRLVEMTTPDHVLVRHDDPTDLKSTTATSYVSAVTGLIPNAALMLELRLTFANTTDQIMLGAVGIVFRPSRRACCGISVSQFGARGDGAALANVDVAGNTLTAASASFSKQDEGKIVSILDSQSGVSLTTTIATLVDSKTVTLSMQAGAAVSGATAYYGTDDTAAIQAALDAGSDGLAVCVPPGLYMITSSLKIPAGNCTLRGAGAASQLMGAVAYPMPYAAMIEAAFPGAETHSNVEIENLTLIGGLDWANCFRLGVKFENITNSVVRGLRITGITADQASKQSGAYGIYFADSTTFSTAEQNFIDMGSYGDTDHFNIGILVQSNMADAYNGRQTNAVPLRQTTIGNRVANNTVQGGTHGINLQNTSQIIIAGNNVHDVIFRSIILYVDNTLTTIAHNNLCRAGSTNIAVDYGNRFITVIGNICDTTTGNENNNIELYLDNSYILLAGNTLSNAGESAVFIGYSATDVNVVGNIIQNAGRAGISITGAMAPQYEEYEDLVPPGGISHVAIRGNIIHVSPSARGIYILGREANASATKDVPIEEVFINENLCVGSAYAVLLETGGSTAAFTPKVGYN